MQRERRRHDLGITDYVTKKYSAALQERNNRIHNINVENIPMQDLPKAATDIERDVDETISTLRSRNANGWSSIARTVRSR